MIILTYKTINTKIEMAQKNLIPNAMTADNVLNEAKQLFKDGSWDHVLTRADISLHKKSLDKCPISAYLVTGTYSKSKEDMVNKIWNVSSPEDAKKNEPNLNMWKLLDRGLNWKIVSQCVNMPFPVWPRHAVFEQVRYDINNDTYLVGFSVDHPDIQLHSSTHVTAHLHMSVYEYHDNGNKTTTVKRITLVDPKGWLPISVVEAKSQDLVDLFISWKK